MSRALEVAKEDPSLRLYMLEGPGREVRHARKVERVHRGRQPRFVPEGLLAWQAERGNRRDGNLLSDTNHPMRTEYWQFSGASVALTTAIYREIGGVEPSAALEAEQLELSCAKTASR